jgi:hypothetical protein
MDYEAKAKPSDDKAKLQKFKTCMKAYDKAFGSWTKRGREIVKQYRDDSGAVTPDGKSGWSSVRFPIVWSNIQTLQPALYARTPEPQCERRWKDKDPLGRTMATILERVSQYQVAEQSFDSVMKPTRDDFLLPGRGQARVMYKPEFTQTIDPATGELVDELVSEVVPCRYEFWEDFGHTPCRSWADVQEVWFNVYLDKDDFVEKFGEKALEKVTFDKVDQNYEKPDGEEGQADKVKVIELWCKKEKKVYWFVEDHSEFLRVEDDPLHLRDFFPCPRPLYSNLTTDNLVPISDVSQYKNAANDLDEMLTREKRMMAAAKVAGAYDKSFPELANILEDNSDLKLYPLANFTHLAQQGGIKNAIDFIPIDQYVAALREIRQSIEMKKNFIDQASGIADIIRGQSAPSETATAQQIKGQFATLRLEDRQREVQRFARDLIALMTEVAIEHLDEGTIAQMVGLQDLAPEEQQIFPQALKALRDDKQRTFKLTIATDSTIAVDEDQEKQRRMETVQAITALIKDNMPIAAQAPSLMPAILETMLFAFRSFGTNGRRLEFTFEQAFEAFAKEQQEQKKNQPPSPEMAKVQSDQQAKQAELQMKQQELQMRAELEKQKLQFQMQLEQVKLQAEIDLKRQEAMIKGQIAQEQAMFKQDQAVAQARTQAQMVGAL